MSESSNLKTAQERLDQAAEALKLSGRTASEADVVRVNRTIGKDDVAFAQAAAGAIAGCKEAYAGLPVTEAIIQDKAARLQGLRDFKGSVDQLGQQVGQEITVLRVELGGYTGMVMKAGEALELHPGTDPNLKKRAGRAAQHLFSLRDGRKGAARSSLAATRSLTSQVSTTEEEKEALKAEVEKLRLENKFLSGESLRPRDLVTPATPAAPASGRRRSKR